MNTTSDNNSRYIEELRMMLSRFPAGLQLSQSDLAFTGWLYFREEETGQKEISNREIISLLGRATRVLGIQDEATQPAAALERLLRFRILRPLDSGHQGSYALTRLGRSLARGLLSEVNFTSEDLCTQLNAAYASMQAVLHENDPDKLQEWLRFVFQKTVQESIDYKLRGIEEELQSQEARIKECGSGGETDQFEAHLDAVRISRKLLEELLDAVQEGSSYFPLIEELYRCREKYIGNSDLLKVLDRSLDFLEGLKRRVEEMLAHLVSFIRSCVKYQGFVGTFSMRDRLIGVQLDLIRYALQNEVKLPVLDASRTVRLSLQWNKETSAQPVRVDSTQLVALEEFIPEKAKSKGAEWRDMFLTQARKDWTELSHRNLLEWIEHLIESCSLESFSEMTCLWFLVQDMPDWKPDVYVKPGEGWRRFTPQTFLREVVLYSNDAPEIDNGPR